MSVLDEFVPQHEDSVAAEPADPKWTAFASMLDTAADSPGLRNQATAELLHELADFARRASVTR